MIFKFSNVDFYDFLISNAWCKYKHTLRMAHFDTTNIAMLQPQFSLGAELKQQFSFDIKAHSSWYTDTVLTLLKKDGSCSSDKG